MLYILVTLINELNHVKMQLNVSFRICVAFQNPPNALYFFYIATGCTHLCRVSEVSKCSLLFLYFFRDQNIFFHIYYMWEGQGGGGGGGRGVLALEEGGGN